MTIRAVCFKRFLELLPDCGHLSGVPNREKMLRDVERCGDEELKSDEGDCMRLRLLETVRMFRYKAFVRSRSIQNFL